MASFKSLANEFEFTSWNTQNDTAVFNYKIIMASGDILSFSEELAFGSTLDANDSALKKALNALHLALGISYYKLYLPPTIKTAYSLNADQVRFWNNLYLNGLAEFLYTHKIDPKHIALFTVAQPQDSTTIQSANSLLANSTTKKALLGIGGGKDSIVAGEILKELGLEVNGFVLESHEDIHTKNVCETMGIEKTSISRKIDPLLLQLNNKPGSLNGHIPISAIFAFAGTVLALTGNYRYVVVANEASASIPNTHWKNIEINHQWSKSFDFEKQAQEYIHDYISNEVTYFSAIRPLSSLAVCRLMARLPDYFTIFTSCNRVARQDPSKRPNSRWCGECDKCLSTFILLAPWLTEVEMETIFNKNMLDSVDLTVSMLALCGIKGIKPLDCVGTTEEILLSIQLLHFHNKYRDNVLMKLVYEQGVIDEQSHSEDLLRHIALQPEHAFPVELKDFMHQLLRLGESL